MSNQILERKNKIISEYTFFDNNEYTLPQWQMDELDKTDERVKKELKKNGFIKTYSIEEVDTRMINLIKNKKEVVIYRILHQSQNFTQYLK